MCIDTRPFSVFPYSVIRSQTRRASCLNFWSKTQLSSPGLDSEQVHLASRSRHNGCLRSHRVWLEIRQSDRSRRVSVQAPSEGRPDGHPSEGNPQQKPGLGRAAQDCTRGRSGGRDRGIRRGAGSNCRYPAVSSRGLVKPSSTRRSARAHSPRCRGPGGTLCEGAVAWSA